MHGRRTAACAFLLCMLAAGQSATAQVQQLGSGEADVVEEFAILEEVARGAARFLELLGPFGCTPTVLRSVVQANVGHGIEVYGSAIAFEAGSYLFDVHNLSSGVRDPTGQVVVEPRNAAAGELYCPYAYRGPHWRDGEGEIFTMDLAYAYDYTTPDTDWFLEPRKSFASGAPVTDGFWSPPYEDIGAGNISMKTYSVPVRTTANLTALGVKGAISRPTPAVESPWLAEDAFSGKLREVDEHGMIEAWFWGVVTIDVPLENVQKWQPWHYPDSMFWAVVGAGAVLWAVACVVLVIVWKYRKQPVINATSPVLNAISLVGVLLITPAAMTFVLEPTPDNVVCRLRVVFSTLAMITIAAPLVAKTWRIARLFGRDPLKRKAIPDSRVVFRAMVLIGVQVVLSTMWVATPGAPEFVARRQTVQTTPPQYLSVAHCTDQESLQVSDTLHGLHCSVSRLFVLGCQTPAVDYSVLLRRDFVLRWVRCVQGEECAGTLQRVDAYFVVHCVCCILWGPPGTPTVDGVERRRRSSVAAWGGSAVWRFRRPGLHLRAEVAATAGQSSRSVHLNGHHNSA